MSTDLPALTDADREALAKVILNATTEAVEADSGDEDGELERLALSVAGAVLAAGYVSETALREEIAQAIEALPEWDGAGWPNHAYEVKADAAAIARGGAR